MSTDGEAVGQARRSSITTACRREWISAYSRQPERTWRRQRAAAGVSFQDVFCAPVALAELAQNASRDAEPFIYIWEVSLADSQ